MAPIIDEIGKKITAVGQGTKNAIADFSQTTKLKDQISSERNRINSYYLEIGQSYYKLHANDPTDPFAQTLQQIQGSLDRIDMLDREIKMIQKVKTCPTCGASVKYDSAFCPKCGVAFRDYHALNAEAAMFCTNCGATLTAGSVFCTECGTPAPVLDAPPVVAPVVPSAPVMPPVAPFPNAAQPGMQKSFCTNCGAELEPASAFCVQCGAPVSAVSTFVPAPPAQQVAPAAPIAPVMPAATPLQVPQAVDVKNCCTKCAAVLEPDSAFCVECGTPVPVPTAPVVPAAEAAPVAPVMPAESPVPDLQAPPVAPAEVEEQQSAGKAVCSKCGAEIEDDAVFCVECGEPVLMVTSASPIVSETPEVPAEEEATEEKKEEKKKPSSRSRKPAAEKTLSEKKEKSPSAKKETPPGEPVTLNCADCGAELEPEATFCVECGAKVGS